MDQEEAASEEARVAAAVEDIAAVALEADLAEEAHTEGRTDLTDRDPRTITITAAGFGLGGATMEAAAASGGCSGLCSSPSY